MTFGDGHSHFETGKNTYIQILGTPEAKHSVEDMFSNFLCGPKHITTGPTLHEAHSKKKLFNMQGSFPVPLGTGFTQEVQSEIGLGRWRTVKDLFINM